MKKIVVFFLLLLLIIPVNTNAKTLNDYYNELAKLQAEYNTNKNNKDLTEEQIKQINTDIGNLNFSISNTRQEIKKAEEDIVLSKEQIADKKVETDGLIQFLQISNGGNIYLEYLFDAENYTDFIYRYEVVKQLSSYNEDLIKELEELIVELNEKEKELEIKIEKLEKEKNQLGTKLATLKLNLDDYSSEGTDIAKDIEDTQKNIKFYEEKGCKRDQDVDECLSLINASEWKYPLAKGCITSEYTGPDNPRLDANGGFHYGIDIGCNSEGTKVYPAADGIIERVVFEAKCGGNMIYIAHNVNGKKYTTAYFHLLKFGPGINSSTKDKHVTTDTVIGYVGGYTTSKNYFPSTGYDKCSYGAHLHFGIAEGNQTHSNHYFDINSINPRKIFTFPKIGKGYFYR